jgi:hypothetical protein
LRDFLGIEVARNHHGMVLSQRKYVMELLGETGQLGAKPSSIPVEPQGRLDEEDDPFCEDKTRYRSVVGQLLYVTVTRPDMSFAVSRASQFMEHPRYRTTIGSSCGLSYPKVSYLKGNPGMVKVSI